jgi:Icc-related predicted phosphoesterase
MRITFISDTHNKHNQITDDLPGGELLIHAGDISSMGYQHEIRQFCKWFNSLRQYDHRVFVAGNHDWGFQKEPEKVALLLEEYPHIDYLEDNLYCVGDDYETSIKVWGSPWQPEFYSWAFNLPRQGEELSNVWEKIPVDIDILVTHGPAHGRVDRIKGQWENLGCELLAHRIGAVRPKIHVCGHIHSGYGYFEQEYEDGSKTHFINAAMLDESYQYTHKPLTVEWDPETNELEFI